MPFERNEKVMAEKAEFTKGKKAVTFLDLFAGAGGISEGFLQSCAGKKYFDFILASDINENCELTHRVRYNYQLGLNTKFLTEDIMSEQFLIDLLAKLDGQTVDVVTGGPSCQSFSLSGRRRKFDKRDDLFTHYLKVIRELRPKYFVMENVKGILTKEKGKIKDAILSEIRSIIDDKKVGLLWKYLDVMLGHVATPFEKNCFICKVKMETADDDYALEQKDLFLQYIGNQFKNLTHNIEYKVSKSNRDISTIRHGLSLLSRDKEREKIKASIIQEKTYCNIDNDAFENTLNEFIEFIDDERIISKILYAFDRVEELKPYENEVDEMKRMLLLYPMTFDECCNELRSFAKNDNTEAEFDDLLDTIRLYRIDKPIVVLSADYGVPQNRERVLFIGCRKDQKMITSIPPTVKAEDRVTVFEAISDLDFIGNGETKTHYEAVDPMPQYAQLLRERSVDGVVKPKGEAHLYSEWSRIGRLSHRFTFNTTPFYVRSIDELEHSMYDTLHEPRPVNIEEDLFNHQTSAQNDEVKQRLRIIAEAGGYDDACKERLRELGLDSGKRNYTPLDPEGQSPTVVTMPDDFIHYSRYRAMTVREMARLQSFDDSFVFQGKRQTGGEKRKSEIPQYTLVGNAVPPLMARAIGNAILSVID